MNLAMVDPRNWFGGSKASTTVVHRGGGQAQGPWTDAMGFVAREVNPHLYEAVREAIPIIDAAVSKTVTLDGILRIEAEGDRVQNAIQDWMDNVQVNDLKHGFQSYYAIQGNELYEQGYCIGEPVLSAGAKDLERLWVADSKGVYFRRNGKVLETWYRVPAAKRNTRKDGTEQIERLLRNSWATVTPGLLRDNGYRLIKSETLDYVAIDNEADNPYGVSKIRSLEFVSQTLATMFNAQKQVWTRFGDPAFSLTYKRKKGFTTDDPSGAKYRTALADNLATVLKGKAEGKSMDFVNAIQANDDLLLEVIGAGGEVLEIETPAKFVLEQVVSKFGIPSWMLGPVWGTSERLADRQIDMMIQDAKTRFEDRRLGLSRIVAMAMQARGVTWKQGDWKLVQELPNLKDELAMAQANFMNAQAEMVRGGRVPEEGGNSPKLARISSQGKILLPTDPDSVFESIDVNPQKNITINLDSDANPVTEEWVKNKLIPALNEYGCGCSVENNGVSGHKGEAYVEDADALMRLESRAARGMLKAWADLFDDTLDALGLDKPKSAKAPDPVWVFGDEMLAMLEGLRDDFIASVGHRDAPLAASTYDAWLRGVVAEAAALDAEAIEAAARETYRTAMAEGGLAQVTDTTVRIYADDIIKELADGAYDGLNPKDVARALRKRFDAHDYDWERLAQSEIATANSQGKMDQYSDMDIEMYGWKRAGGACPVCIGLEQGGPYVVGKGPLPSADSHPWCRCTVYAIVEDE